MHEGFKPMLSGKKGDVVQFPVIVSPKLDGIRSVYLNETPVSRTLKKLPNKYVQERLSHPCLLGLDGEVLVGPTHAPDVFSRTTKMVMSHNKEDACALWVFDAFKLPHLPFKERLARAGDWVCIAQSMGLPVHAVPHKYVHNQAQLEDAEEEYVSMGYEGIMLRSPEGTYKFGRSTTKEGALLKWKRFEDAEAVVIGFAEQMHNGNEATKDAFGNTKRSTHKENKTGKATLGAIIGRDVKTGLEVRCTGFTDTWKREIWENQEKYLGKQFVYKWFPHGSVEKARHPGFKYWREDGF